jgi:DNA (cytosine-5)-methyltransferase 1
MNELALFAGAGGGILAGKLLGWQTVCAVEWEAYPASVLCARQNDGLLPPFPIWDDVQTFDGKPWRGIVDVVSGGFPCQDISAAGGGAGIDGERSGMWTEMARIIYEVQPRYAFVENSPMLTSRGLGRVLGDLASMGFDARWGVLGAADVGAKHQRDRIWIVGKATDSTSLRPHNEKNQRVLESQRGSEFYSEQPRHPSKVAYAQQQGLEGRPNSGEQEIAWVRSGGALADTSFGRYKPSKSKICTGWDSFKHKSWWAIEPNVGRVANGVAARVDRLKAIGNGQVPLCAATAWKLLSETRSQG